LGTSYIHISLRFLSGFYLWSSVHEGRQLTSPWCHCAECSAAGTRIPPWIQIKICIPIHEKLTEFIQKELQNYVLILASGGANTVNPLTSTWTSVCLARIKTKVFTLLLERSLPPLRSQRKRRSKRQLKPWISPMTMAPCAAVGVSLPPARRSPRAANLHVRVEPPLP
jgi:hypothetical protein